jgi:hypothetical protein
MMQRAFTRSATTKSVLHAKRAALEAYPAGLSQAPNFFVICFYHRITMQKTNALNLETWRCQKLWDLHQDFLK